MTSLGNMHRMGKHLILDFIDVSVFNLSSFSAINELFTSILAKISIPVEDVQTKEFLPEGLTVMYMLRLGHLTIHSWPGASACAIDFYHSSADSWNTIHVVEEGLCNAFGWANCSSTITLPRGEHTRLWCNDGEARCEVLNHVKLLHREKTPFQELRVYDTKYMGRILLLDGQVQISDALDDNYTIYMSSEIVKDDTDYAHILIIGGGDLLIASYLLEKYPKVKKITVCEVDQRVVETVSTFFKPSSSLTTSLASGRLEIIYEDGAEFVRKLATNNQFVDGIIVDCTDVWLEDCVASTLFTVEFYTSLKAIMSIGARFSQQLSFQQLVPAFREKCIQSGFTDIEINSIVTPEYGEDLPIGNVGKTLTN